MRIYRRGGFRWRYSITPTRMDWRTRSITLPRHAELVTIADITIFSNGPPATTMPGAWP